MHHNEVGPVPFNHAWLKTYREDIIEPSREIIDPHHHLWDKPNQRYLVEELTSDLNGGHNICATVYVECSSMYRTTGPEHLKPVGETEFVAKISAPKEGQAVARQCAGIVGLVDIALGERSAEVLEAHVAAGGGRFRGVRCRTASHADKAIQTRVPTPLHVLLQESSRRTIANVERQNLSLDVWLFYPQLSDLIDICRSFPNLTIILNHVGGPLGIGPYAGRRNEVLTDWERQIAQLASFPNLRVKLGGMANRFIGFDFHLGRRPPSSDDLVRVWNPYVQFCIEKFGPSRCMFESDFPVAKAACDYHVLWNAFKKMVKDYSEHEKRMLFFQTAAETYRLPAS